MLDSAIYRSYKDSSERFERFGGQRLTNSFIFVSHEPRQLRNDFDWSSTVVVAMQEKRRRGVQKSLEKTSESRRKGAPTRTFKHKPLEGEFVHFLQLSCPSPLSESDLALATKELSGAKIELMSHDSFDAPGAEASILGNHLLHWSTESGDDRSVKVRDLPTYLARLCETRLLTPEEEKNLFIRMNYLRYRAALLQSEIDAQRPDEWLIRRVRGLLQAADWHRDCIVKSNMRLVISIVKKFVNLQNGFDELLSDGIVAIIRAVDKFDIGLGFRFSTYATQVIRRNTYRRMMDRQKERQKQVGSIHESGFDVSDDSRASSMTEERWHELRSRMAELLNQLDRREKFIIRARFSLGGHRKVQTLQALADRLGVSKERVRQLEKRALDKLRLMSTESSLVEAVR